MAKLRLSRNFPWEENMAKFRLSRNFPWEENMGEFQTPDLSETEEKSENHEEEKPKRILLPNAQESRPQILDPEKRKQPGILIESAEMGTAHYAPGIICYDEKWQLCKVRTFEMEDDPYAAKLAKKDRPDIKQPEKYQSPVVTIEYPDGNTKRYRKNAVIKLKPVYDKRLTISREEPFFDESHIELRGHEFKLGELVSFGNGVGRLAQIFPGEKIKIGIIAVKERGKGGPTYLWIVDAAEVDYVEHDENGAIKRNPDNTIFKPTLSKESEQSPE